MATKGNLVAILFILGLAGMSITAYPGLSSRTSDMDCSLRAPERRTYSPIIEEVVAGPPTVFRRTVRF